MYRFPWYLTLGSTNHASSNPGEDSNQSHVQLEEESHCGLVIKTRIISLLPYPTAHAVIYLDSSIYCDVFQQLVSNPLIMNQEP